jgi:hypothetical protein
VRAESESSLKFIALCTDCGGEFTTREFAEYCTIDGVHYQQTVPYNSQQNDVIEHQNGMVVATTRSMLKAKGVPGWFWGEAVSIAIYVLNRCLMKSMDDMTLFVPWHRKKSMCTTSGHLGASYMFRTRHRT